MLQQTRVETVIPYYARFRERFPSVAALAAAGEGEVLALWSGLGYYSRARNLHRAAKQIAAAGAPADYESVRALAGVGPYTAAAISSIALDLAHAAVDGNVVRVLSRVHNDASEITAPAARRQWNEYAAGLLDRRRPGDFNQAMMELGATVCVPRIPLCGACPVREFCQARAAGTERELPVKRRQAETRQVCLDVAIVTKNAGRNARVFLVRRAADERRLAGFWELPEKAQLEGVARLEKVAEFRHQIVNDRFHVRVWRGRMGESGAAGMLRGKWIARAELAQIPLTTIARKALAAPSS